MKKIFCSLCAAALFIATAPAASSQTAPKAPLPTKITNLNQVPPKERKAFLRYIRKQRNKSNVSPIKYTSKKQANRLAIYSHFTDRTTSDFTVDDPRIGFLVIQKDSDNNRTWCTADNIGGRFWLTAQHCVNGLENNFGYIVHPNPNYYKGTQDFAGIEEIWDGPAGKDVALVKVGSGLDVSAFQVATTLPQKDQISMLEGYGRSHTDEHSPARLTPTSITVRATSWTNTNVSYPKSGLQYSDETIWDTKQRDPSSDDVNYTVAHGDSGGPVFTGNTIFGVVSGAPDNDTKYFYGANVDAISSWIKDTTENYGGPSLVELWWSYQGGLMAQREFGNGRETHNSFGSSPVLSSAL